MTHNIRLKTREADNNTSRKVREQFEKRSETDNNEDPLSLCRFCVSKQQNKNHFPAVILWMISSRTWSFAAIKPPSFGSRTCGRNATASSHCSALLLPPLLSQVKQLWRPTPPPSRLCDAFTDIERQQDKMKTLLYGTGEIQFLVVLLLRATAVVRVGRLWLWLLLTRQQCCWLREKRLKRQLRQESIISEMKNVFVPLITVKEPSILTQSVRNKLLWQNIHRVWL